MLSAIWLFRLAISIAVSLPFFAYLKYSTNKDVTSAMFRIIAILVLSCSSFCNNVAVAIVDLYAFCCLSRKRLLHLQSCSLFILGRWAGANSLRSKIIWHMDEAECKCQLWALYCHHNMHDSWSSDIHGGTQHSAAFEASLVIQGRLLQSWLYQRIFGDPYGG